MRCMLKDFRSCVSAGVKQLCLLAKLCIMHSKTLACATPHCRVLPHGEFNGMIPEPLPVYYENFMMTSVNSLNKFIWLEVNYYLN